MVMKIDIDTTPNRDKKINYLANKYINQMKQYKIIGIKIIGIRK
jgi:hypothetical protein